VKKIYCTEVVGEIRCCVFVYVGASEVDPVPQLRVEVEWTRYMKRIGREATTVWRRRPIVKPI
jgi:hypothetical protein